MSSRNTDGEDNAAEDTKGGEDGSPLTEQRSTLLRDNTAIRDALAAQLSANALFRGNAGQASALDALQLLRGGSAIPGANTGALGNFGNAPFMRTGMPSQATILREARLRLLIQQHQEHELLHQMLQRQQYSQMQQQQQVRQAQQQNQQVQNHNLLANLSGMSTSGLQLSHAALSQSLAGLNASDLNARLAWTNLSGAFGGNASERNFNLPRSVETHSMPSLFTGNTAASVPANFVGAHLPGQAAAPSSTTAASRRSSSAQGVARMPDTRRPTAEDDQPEMKDAEYFELFGFNDEDGVQIINETFPHKLYRMLFEVEKKGQEDIVSFFPHGKAFIVHQPKAFVEKIMPKYFSTSRMSSFQRQLNLYGFQRIDDGPEKGGFVHQYFQKGQRSLCNKIKRQRYRPHQSAAQEAPTGVGRGSPLGMQQQTNFATAGAAAGTSAPTQLSQNQQAQVLLQSMLNQQQEQNNRDARREPQRGRDP